jgi:DNA-binding ferritin-like protein
MSAFSKQRENLEDELDELGEELLAADANYENAVTIPALRAAEAECKRLRAEIKARRQQLRALLEDLESGSDPTTSAESPKKKSQAAGE